MHRTIEECLAEAADAGGPARRALASGVAPVRVAMVTSLYPPSVGGIQSHTHALAGELAGLGAEVHVVARPAGGHPAHASRGRLHVHRVGASPGAPPALATLAFVAGALRVVRGLRPDVVHAQQLLSPTTVALLAAAADGTPILLNPHACGAIGDVGVLSASRLGRARLREAVRRADLFVAISSRIAGELRAAGVPAARIVAIPNGVDVERFRPAPPRERAALRRALGLPDGPLVLYAGRLSAEKGVDVLVDAWPRVLARVPDARLWMLGDGAERERLLAAARRHGVGPSIALPGPIEEVAPFVRAADAVVLPSRTEGMPIAMLEAMACAAPVVATAVGGSAEVLRDGVTGRLVPPERPDRLADGIVEALRDEAARERARVAREEVVSRYGLHHVAERFLDVYARLRRDGPASQRGAHRPWSTPHRARADVEVASRT